MLKGIEEYYEKETPALKSETTKGVMYKFYADNQNPKCFETKKEILAGERFVLHNGQFFGIESETYHNEFFNAQNHTW